MSMFAVGSTEQESRAARAALMVWEAEQRNAAEYSGRAGLRAASVRVGDTDPDACQRAAMRDEAGLRDATRNAPEEMP